MDYLPKFEYGFCLINANQDGGLIDLDKQKFSA